MVLRGLKEPIQKEKKKKRKEERQREKNKTRITSVHWILQVAHKKEGVYHMNIGLGQQKHCHVNYGFLRQCITLNTYIPMNDSVYCI